MNPVSPLRLLVTLLIAWVTLAFSPVTIANEFSVKGVSAGDVLSMRKYPGVKSKIIAQIPPNGSGLKPTGKRVQKGRSIWAQVKWKTQTGWVNTRYITPSRKQQTTGKTTPMNSHTHPANRCTRSVTHSHPNGKRSHKHRYSCMNKQKNSAANKHSHPANKCTKSITHSHPNGKRTHTHRYSCQSNRKTTTGNEHQHPANPCTRSIIHSHPNGMRKHTHRYSCK